MPAVSPTTLFFNNPRCASLVVSFLKDIALSDAGAGSHFQEDKKLMLLPHRFPKFLSGLLRLNRVFFFATVPVLWEKMQSIIPFVLLLKPIIHDRVITFPSGIALALQERLRDYSRHTKTLMLQLNPWNPVMAPAWISYVLPVLTFPNLDRVFIFSVDLLNTGVMLSVMPYVQEVYVDFDGILRYSRPDPEALPSDFSTTFTAKLLDSITTPKDPNPHFGKPGRLKNLTIMHTIHSVDIANVAHLRTLTHLRLKMRYKSSTPKELANLNWLINLETLIIEQDIMPLDSPNVSDIEMLSNELNASVSRPPSPLKYLRGLEVLGNGLMQVAVAIVLSPQTVRKLRLEILRDVDLEDKEEDNHLVMMPLVVILYARRNEHLKSLIVVGPGEGSCVNQGSADFQINPDIARGMRGNTLCYSDHQRFPGVIVSLCHLKVFSIVRIPFLDTTVGSRLVYQLENLPQLKSFTFFPEPMTDDLRDQVAAPSLKALRRLSNTNPRLTHIGMILNLDKIPKLSKAHIKKAYLKGHGLRTLSVSPHPQGEELASINIEDRTLLADYIDVLFPRVKNFTDLWPMDSTVGQWDFWIDIETIVLAYQRVRARTLRLV